MGLFLNVFSYCSYVSIIYICYPIRMLNLFIFIGLYIPLGTPMKGAQFCQKNRPFDCWGIAPLCSSKQCEIGTSAAMANKAFRSKQPQWWFNKQLVNKTARLKMI